MNLFLDTANLEEIAEALAKGAIDGITTNPTLLSREKRDDFYAHVGRIIHLVRQAGADLPLSVEVFSMDPDDMLRQAFEFTERFRDYRELYVKIPIGWNELQVIKELSRNGIRVNCTACMSISQSVLAAKAGAAIVSLFWGRIRDGGGDPFRVVQETRRLLDRGGMACRIIVGSIRKKEDVEDALVAGGHIVTVPFRFLKEMTSHPKTREVVDQFLRDFSGWIQPEPARK